MVHGVVVQIINERVFFSSKLNFLINFSLLLLSKSNLTSMAIEFLSIYSTSASANDDPHSGHQCTGLKPFSTCPL